MNLPTDELAAYEVAMEALENCITSLYHQAFTVSDDYLRHVDAMEAKSTGWETRSNLQLSCTRKGNHLDLKWTGLKWYGPKGARHSIRLAITKSKETLGYSEDKPKPYAKSWEIEKVLSTEAQLQMIRRKATHTVKAIISLRHAIRLAKKKSVELADSDE